MSEQVGAGPAADPALVKVGRLEVALSNVLRTGVIVSIALVTIGAVVSFVRQGGWNAEPGATLAAADGRAGLIEQTRALAGQVRFQEEPAFPHSLGGLAHSLGAMQGRGIIVLGLVVLIATPVVRVAASIVAFALARDRRYTIITSIVLALLLLSFLLGKAAG